LELEGSGCAGDNQFSLAVKHPVVLARRLPERMSRITSVCPAFGQNDIACNIRIVLDTDVVLSGLRSTVGASRILLLAIEAGIVTPLVSVATVIEYEAVLKRAEHLAASHLEVDDVDMFLDAFVAHAEAVVPHFTNRPSIRDPDDEIFVSVAVNGRADALVTFNMADYAPADDRAAGLGIAICRPGDILRRLTWRPSAISPFDFLRR